MQRTTHFVSLFLLLGLLSCGTGDGGLEDQATPLLRDFIAARQDEESHAIALRLIEMGHGATPALISALNDNDREMRAGAAIILGRIGSPEAIEPLIESLRDPDKFVRGYASEALGRIGPAAIPSLVPCLADGSADVRARAGVALWYMRDAALPALPDLLHALERERDDEAFQKLSWALVHCGAEASQAIPLLIDRLDSEDEHIRSWAQQALGEMGPAAVAPLVEAMQNAGKPHVLARAAFALEDIGPEAADAVPVLVTALEHPNDQVRRAAADALGAIRSDPARSVPALTKHVDDPSAYVREHAIDALVPFGEQGSGAVPALLARLRAEPELAGHAVRALGSIGPASRDVVPLLIPRLASENWSTRVGAMVALQGIGMEVPEAVPLVVEALSDDSDVVRYTAAVTLRTIDPIRFREMGSDLVPPLLEAGHRLDQDQRVGAAAALGDLGKDAAEALPELKDKLRRCEEILSGRGEKDYLGKHEEVVEYAAALRTAIKSIEEAVQVQAAR